MVVVGERTLAAAAAGARHLSPAGFLRLEQSDGGVQQNNNTVQQGVTNERECVVATPFPLAGGHYRPHSYRTVQVRLGAELALYLLHTLWLRPTLYWRYS